MDPGSQSWHATITQLDASSPRVEVLIRNVRGAQTALLNHDHRWMGHARQETPKYPPPPRSGNAFAAAVIAATADLLFLIVLFGFFAQ